jgi:hypothetical protein
MNKLAICILFLVASISGFSQKVYFVYLQTEAEQPFFVKINGKIQSSSASGYLILSKLRDSTYNFTVGFPQSKWPEQNFSVTINNKDHGYLLKNFGEKGWGLFDLQTLAVQMAVAGSAKIEEKKMEEYKDVSVFTDILSKAADDPSLKEKPLLPKLEEKKTETNIEESVSKANPKEISKDSLVYKPVEIIEKPVVAKEEQKVETTEQPVAKAEEITTPVAEEYKPTVVTKKAESSTTEGFGLVFVDDLGNGINDTIRILIPNPKKSLTIINEEPRDEKKFIDILPDTVKKKDEQVTEQLQGVPENPVDKKTPKINCPAVASESDFFKLRKKMAAAEGDDGMLAEAKKYFKAKCFSTEQVKNLGSMFLNDEARYKFFDLAYSYVTDADRFSVLQNELKEEYYINRFKAMVRN